jgi:S-adenosylmethionine:tRNA ribosyltransferase-isomerase
MTDLQRYHYDLPRHLIAEEPLPNRADSRLMVVDRSSNRISHRHFRDLPELLRTGDSLVLNDTRVLPARIVGYRERSKGQWEGLFLRSDPPGVWQLLARCRGKLAAGERIQLVDRRGREALVLTLLSKGEDARWFARPESAEPVEEILERVGRVPLPPYIRKGEMRATDRDRYQTVYARRPGSVAAPTAGLHFTAALIGELIDVGVTPLRVTLHVGPATFRPITSSRVEDHVLDSEWCELDADVANRLNSSRSAGGRVVAVGSTTVRVLETAYRGGSFAPFSGETRLCIRPGYSYQAVDALITNFHLPRTSLLVLVREFGGDERIRAAYDEAIREEYRFYSYGDAMLIV